MKTFVVLTLLVALSGCGTLSVKNPSDLSYIRPLSKNAGAERIRMTRTPGKANRHAILTKILKAPSTPSAS